MQLFSAPAQVDFRVQALYAFWPLLAQTPGLSCHLSFLPSFSFAGRVAKARYSSWIALHLILCQRSLFILLL